MSRGHGNISSSAFTLELETIFFSLGTQTSQAPIDEAERPRKQKTQPFGERSQVGLLVVRRRLEDDATAAEGGEVAPT